MKNSTSSSRSEASYNTPRGGLQTKGSSALAIALLSLIACGDVQEGDFGADIGADAGVEEAPLSTSSDTDTLVPTAEPDDTASTILNGTTDNANSPLFPEVVMLEFNGNGCSASVITSSYLLTAAHCVVNAGHPTPAFAATGVKVSTVEDGEVYDGLAWFSTFDWNPAGFDKDHDDDVALIRLNSPVSELTRGRFHRGTSVPGLSHHVVGWGFNRDFPGLPAIVQGWGTLRWGIMSYHSQSNAGLRLHEISQRMMHGDSGGPAIVRRTNNATRSIITGVMSGVAPDDTFVARTGNKWSWIFAESTARGHRISCRSASAQGVPYYYGCTNE